MGDLIVMTRPTGSSRRETSRNATAEILFFTGVRYHRMPEHPAAVEETPVVSPARRRSEKAKKAAEARRIKRLA